ncbi:OmpA family protein [uncultured Hymenobacter sp.]|uniref:OmpA family protein n=1 Tax=uncultured Hymenobacter sp. TaxID=170016 RepID=UPI0035CB31EC
MKFRLRFGWCLLLLLLIGPAIGSVQAQDYAGQWQGVEFNPRAESSEVWPSQLNLRAGAKGISGTLYQLALSAPEYAVTYRMQGARAGRSLRLAHTGILSETKPDDLNWCLGTMLFTYDAALEKLTGRSAYPTPGCRNGTLELYRVRLKSAGAVPAGQLSTLRVSGRNVRWFADAALRRPLARGNTYRTKLRKTTTFYITQGFYPTEKSPVVPVTVRVAGPAPAAGAVVPPLANSLPPPAGPKPLVLPAVLFRLGTAELLPESEPTLTQLAARLQANPTLRVRIAGHTDRIGEADKNQLLSEQRAAAVKDYLTQKSGIAAERLAAIGYGDTQLLYPSPDLRNRRVEVIILNGAPAAKK